MKTNKIYTKYSHAFFPTGKGIVIIWDGALSLLYRLDGDQFSVCLLNEVPENTKQLDSILELAGSDASLGFSTSGTLPELLKDMPDAVLGGIYNAVVGYDPFPENEGARALVVDYLTTPEAQEEVF